MKRRDTKKRREQMRSELPALLPEQKAALVRLVRRHKLSTVLDWATPALWLMIAPFYVWGVQSERPALAVAASLFFGALMVCGAVVRRVWGAM